MMANAAIDLFGPNHFITDQDTGLRGGSFRVPTSMVLESSGGSTLATVANRSRLQTRTEPMSNLTWRPTASRTVKPSACFVLAACSVMGTFVAELEDPEANQDAIADNFRSFLGEYAHSIGSIGKGTELERFMTQLPSLAKTSTPPDHTVRFSVVTDAGSVDFVREWDVPGSFDVGSLHRRFGPGSLNARIDALRDGTLETETVKAPPVALVPPDPSTPPDPSAPTAPAEQPTQVEDQREPE